MESPYTVHIPLSAAEMKDREAGLKVAPHQPRVILVCTAYLQHHAESAVALVHVN